MIVLDIFTGFDLFYFACLLLLDSYSCLVKLIVELLALYITLKSNRI